MAEPKKSNKIIRINHYESDKEKSPFIALLGGEEPEVRVAASNNTFLSVKKQGVSVSPGLGNNITIQGMSHNMTYGGMLQDLPFPLSIMPTTTFNPFPKQFMKIPFIDLTKDLGELMSLLSTMVGI